MRSSWWIALGWAAFLGGCTRLDADHCANQAGSATCKGIYGRGFCSECEASQNGCVAAMPAAECRADESSITTTGQAGTSSPSTGDAGADSVDAGMGEGPDDSPGDDDDTGTASGATSESNTDASETGDPGYCGDGQLDPGEACDGEAFDPNMDTCMDFGLESGEVRCKNGCTIDVSQCVGFDTCGNGTIEDWEECEEGDLGGATCASMPEYIDGQLGCDDCLFNTTNCVPCVPSGGACQATEQCCSGSCGLLGCLG